MSQQTDAQCVRGMKIMALVFGAIFLGIVLIARTIAY